MVTMKQLLADVAVDITPTARPPDVDAIVEAINKQLRKQKVKAIARLGGSFAKDSWLLGDHDVDIFVAFDLSYKDKPISDILEKVLKFLKPDRVHGSRDYFQVEDHFKCEIIPVLAIKKASDAQNITDFSLRHVTWVNGRSKKLKTDIRLAKKFCKGQRVYGAESYIRGFSGHVVDLLVIHYDGFLPFLRAATRWKPKTVIDINNSHKGKALFELNKSKTEGPLVLVDPVQPDRNAAASLTMENYERFIHGAKSFLARPSINHFEHQAPDLVALAKRGTLVKVRASATEGSDDVAGTRLLKLFEHLKTLLADSGFTVTNAAWDWDTTSGKALLWFVTKEPLLPKTRAVMGPPVKIKKHADAFKKKYGKTTTVKGRLCAMVQNRVRCAAGIIKEAVKTPYLQEKAKNIKVD